MSFIDFAEVKARCAIEQVAKLLDLTVESLGIASGTAEALGIGYAPNGRRRVTSPSPSGSHPAR
jgi:hypothetical protein